MYQSEEHRIVDESIVMSIHQNPFIAHVTMNVKRYMDDSIGTMGVRFNPDSLQFELIWSQAFVKKIATDCTTNGKLNKSQMQATINGLIMHEMYHIVLGHCTTRKRDPHDYWNIATDRAINSIITECHTKSQQIALPKECISVENFPVPNTPELLSSEEYFEMLDELIKRDEEMKKYLEEAIEREMKGGSGGDGGDQKSDNEGNGGGNGKSMYNGRKITIPTNHGMWGDDNEANRKIADAIAREIAKKAAQKADACNGWGNMPAALVEKIREFANVQVDWRTMMRYLIGKTNPFGRKNSIKKINKKYPYIHPGRSRNRIASVLIAVDQSGSVDDAALAKAFGVIRSMTKKITVDVVNFDAEVDKKSLCRWSKGSKRLPQRTRCGGTDFNAPTRFADEQRQWDLLIIITDGECNKPIASRTRRMWIIVPNRNLLFDTDEGVINMK